MDRRFFMARHRIVSVAQLRQTPQALCGERERKILRELARGEREIAAGRGISLERVLADADKVLARARK
jgi:DNA-binding CsgD family transcriptional regulator